MARRFLGPGVAMAQDGWRWLRGLWTAGQPLFQGRALLVTNTLGCGALMAAGDGARQSWEIRARPGQTFDPRRSGDPTPRVTLDLWPPIRRSLHRTSGM